jgi:hypothetical protein
MTSKRCSVELEGDNSLTAHQLSLVLDDLPIYARVRTMAKPGKDPIIVIWWDEEL